MASLRELPYGLGLHLKSKGNIMKTPIDYFNIQQSFLRLAEQCSAEFRSHMIKHTNTFDPKFHYGVQESADLLHTLYGFDGSFEK